MRKESFHLKLPQVLKDKLIRDSASYKFSTPTAYLHELIKKGLPLTGNLDIRLQLIEKKLDSLTDNVFAHNKRTSSFLGKIYKKLYVVYKVAAYILARTFFIKPGNISQDDFAQTKAFIEEQVKKIEKSSGSGL
ncbi:MAG: hypothetical protein KAW12_30590 [Candidatus Aminicenantes bacterium]|nr:hypothetical protein [Candidatus Aminicenantes bacterium]